MTKVLWAVLAVALVGVGYYSWSSGRDGAMMKDADMESPAKEGSMMEGEGSMVKDPGMMAGEGDIMMKKPAAMETEGSMMAK